MTQALAALNAYRQWILVKLVPLPEGGIDKIPCSLTASGVNAHDPANWLDHDHARAAAAARGPAYGVGFVLTPNDPFWCLDIDKALMPNGQWDNRVHETLSVLPGTACEVSASGRGVHVWGRGVLPALRSIKNTAQRMELYHQERFILLGQPGATGEIAETPPAALQHLVDRWFPPRSVHLESGLVSEGPREGWRGPTDDDELIERGRRMRSDIGHALGGKAHFADLWDGNIEALVRAYPASSDSSATPYDGSSVDLAMANALAYLTGCDGPRMERLLRRWVLWRDKWEREDYRAMTVQAVCSPGRPILQDRPTVADLLGPAAAAPGPAPAPAAGPIDTSGASPFLAAGDQRKLFEGCTYVLAFNGVLMPSGDIVSEPKFNSWFGQHRFVMDRENSKISNKAWEAFTRSTLIAWPRVHAVHYSPAAAFGAIRTIDGRLEVNAYRTPHIDRRPGDVSRFLDFMRRILPAERDREILLSWAKAAVQHPGRKFLWACVLQGAEGNGKSLIGRILEYAVGPRVTARPKASDLAGQFNPWALGTVLAIAEDLHKSRDGADLLESLKPLITERRQSIEAKGVDAYVTEVFWNLLVTTNHKASLRKTKNDRRLAVFFCAQQTAEDIIRDGMGGDYFPDLTDWFEAEGYAYVAHWLATDPINPEFNPAGRCVRAPSTSSEAAAVAASLDPTQTAVQEAIEEGRGGFCGEFVSSAHLSALIEQRRSGHIWPQQRRGELMAGLGYMLHQALPEGGRLTRYVPGPDGVPIRTRLYVRQFSAAAGLATPAEVADAYFKAQERRD